MAYNSFERPQLRSLSDLYMRAFGTAERAAVGALGSVVQEFADYVNSGYGSFDLVRGDNAISLYFDLPGTNKADITLDVTKGQQEYIMKVVSTRKPVYTRTTECERFFGTKTCEVSLPLDIDPSSVVASYQNGVLFVSVQNLKKENVNNVSIPIG